MMLGGQDIFIEKPVFSNDVQLILRAARSAWPNAFVEAGDDGTAVPMRDALRRSWMLPEEIFVYKDRAAYESWTKLGRTDENAEAMIVVMFECDGISFVAEPDSSTIAIVMDLIRVIQNNRQPSLRAA